MKTPWLISFFVFLCLTGIGQSPEDKYPETVYIKIYEPYIGTLANRVEPKIVVTDADNVVTNIPLSPSHRLIDDNKEFESNQLKIRTELQKWHSKGFLVKALSTAAPFDGLLVTAIVLQKN